MKFIIPLLALILVLAACQPNAQPTEALHTIAVLPGAATDTAVPTEAQTAEVTTEATTENTVEATKTVVPPTPTATVKPSNTSTPTVTPSVEPTQAASARLRKQFWKHPVMRHLRLLLPGHCHPPATSIRWRMYLSMSSSSKKKST